MIVDADTGRRIGPILVGHEQFSYESRVAIATLADAQLGPYWIEVWITYTACFANFHSKLYGWGDDYSQRNERIPIHFYNMDVFASGGGNVSYIYTYYLSRHLPNCLGDKTRCVSRPDPNLFFVLAVV